MDKMSIWIIVLIVIGISSVTKFSNIEEEDEVEDEVEEAISRDRICMSEKDYVDGSVIFSKGFLVMVDRMYYEFIWDRTPFNYMAEGVTDFLLHDYDKTWPFGSPADLTKKGRFLGGFYHNYFPVTIRTKRKYNFSDWDIDKHPLWNIPSNYTGMEHYFEAMEAKDPTFVWQKPPNNDSIVKVAEYHERTPLRQIVFFEDQYKSRYLYHIKVKDVEGMLDLDINKQSFHGVTPRGRLSSFFKSFKLSNPLLSLPILYDLPRLQLIVIINQKDSNDVPRLYYNSFKYKDFDNSWKYVNLPKGYRYNEFIPFLFSSHPFIYNTEWDINYPIKYRVIAEPFRDLKTDKGRGPSFLFALQWDNTGIPSLRNLKKPGMSVFKCKFSSASSTILYFVFGIIISILAAIFVLFLCCVGINYFFARERVVIIKRSDRSGQKRFGDSSTSSGHSSDKTRMRRKTSGETTHTSVDDKRSALNQNTDIPKKQIII